MGGYLVLHPHRRVRVIMLRMLTEVPGYVAVGLWFVFQLISALGVIGQGSQSSGGVAFMAHIGGFIAGVVLVKIVALGAPAPRRALLSSRCGCARKRQDAHRMTPRTSDSVRSLELWCSAGDQASLGFSRISSSQSCTGRPHTGAHVPLSPAANLFVVIVVLAGPVIGLALTWPAARIGNWLVAATMGSALVFGVVNHFVFASPDHVGHVDPQWQLLFATTAVLLSVTEAIGVGLAICGLRQRK